MSRWRDALRDAVAEVWGKPLTMNVSMPIAAVLLDLDFPAAMVKAIPILARTAGLLAHLAEEQQQPIGFLMAGAGGGGGRLRAGRCRMLEPRSRRAVGGAGPARRQSTARSSPTCSSARRSTARSSAGGLRDADAVGGLDDDRARCRFTEKTSSARAARRRTRSARISRVPRDEIVRIYSTSGTTGTPSYIPLTAAATSTTG